MTFLAQGLAGLDAKAPTPLPGAPLMHHLFLESPALLAVLLVGLSIVTFAVLAMRGKPRVARIAVACGALTAGTVIAISMLIETDREKIGTLTKEMISAVAAGDAATLDTILADDAVLLSPLSGQPLPKSDVLARVATDFRPGGRYHIRDHRVLELQAEAEDTPRGRVQVKVRVTPADGPPTPVWVRIDYEKDAAGQWRAGGIAVVSMGGISGQLR